MEVESVDLRRCQSNIKGIDSSMFHHHSFDVTSIDELKEVSKGCDLMFHLASNSDIRASDSGTSVDFKDTLQATWSAMEAARANEIKRVYFPSTSAVYGNAPGVNLSESMGELRPISHYGSCKLAAESLLSSYAYMYSMNILIFRASNVVGPRLTHGVMYDFIKKLEKDNGRLEILGDGRQSKEYVHVDDLVAGVCDFISRVDKGISVYNISTASSITVNQIADAVCLHLGLNDVKYEYTGGNRGWRGDVPSFKLDISKAISKGWRFKYDSEASINRTMEHYAATLNS